MESACPGLEDAQGHQNADVDVKVLVVTQIAALEVEDGD